MRRILKTGVAWALAVSFLVGAPAPSRATPADATLLADSAYGAALSKRIREAKRRVICAFYLFKVTERRGNIPAALASDLVQAQKRGVAITVILEGDKPVGPENRLVVSYLARNGVRVVFPSGRRTLHAKAVVVDDRYVMLGSHNLSHAALSKNRELSVMLDSPELAGQVTRYLEAVR